MARTTRNLLIAAAVIALAAVVWLLWVFPAVWAKTGDNSNPDPDTQAAWPVVYGTYSKNKPGELNFNENMFIKAQKAVDNGKYKDVLSYVTDKNFDKDAVAWAEKLVEQKKFKTVLEAIETHPDAGKLAFWLYYDPAFLAATACAVDQQGLSEDKPILAPEANLPVPQRPDQAHLRYLDKTEDRQEAYDRLIAILFDDPDLQTALKEIDSYESSMYQVKDGIKKGVPSVVVRKSTNTGGHFVVFVKVVKGEKVILRLRLECGYQAINVWKWTPPPDPPHDDGKDINKSPQHRWKDKDDGSTDWISPDPENKDQDKSLVDKFPEDKQPEKYESPDPPVKKTEKKKEKTKEEKSTEASTVAEGNDSEIVDNSKGKTEEKDGKTYNVTAGDGKDKGDFKEGYKKLEEDPHIANDEAMDGDLPDSMAN